MHCKLFLHNLIKSHQLDQFLIDLIPSVKASTLLNLQVGLEEKFGKDRVFNTPLCEQVLFSMNFI